MSYSEMVPPPIPNTWNLQTDVPPDVPGVKHLLQGYDTFRKVMIYFLIFTIAISVVSGIYGVVVAQSVAANNLTEALRPLVLGCGCAGFVFNAFLSILVLLGIRHFKYCPTSLVPEGDVLGKKCSTMFVLYFIANTVMGLVNLVCLFYFYSPDSISQMVLPDSVQYSQSCIGGLSVIVGFVLFLCFYTFSKKVCTVLSPDAKSSLNVTWILFWVSYIPCSILGLLLPYVPNDCAKIMTGIAGFLGLVNIAGMIFLFIFLCAIRKGLKKFINFFGG